MLDHDADLRDLLARVRTIAVVGASDRPDRPSHGVMRFLAGRGYRMAAVNPTLAGTRIDGIPVVAGLADLPEPADMVDVFRNSAAVGSIVDEVLALPVRPTAIWLQLGVRDAAAAARAEAQGIAVVMDRCPKIDISRLFAPDWRRDG